MAARALTDDPVQPKPRSDAYTGMLVVSLLALLVGCLLLYLDFRRYPSTKPPEVSSSSAPVQQKPPPPAQQKPPPPAK